MELWLMMIAVEIISQSLQREEKAGKTFNCRLISFCGELQLMTFQISSANCVPAELEKKRSSTYGPKMD